MKSYTIFIPAYNEEAIIRANIIYIYQCVQVAEKKLKAKIQLVILNDGSTDNTRKILNKLKKEIPIKVIHDNGPSRRENLIKNMIRVKTDYVGFLDCDLSTDMDDFLPLLDNIKYYDIVTGSRYCLSSKINRNFGRLMISYLFNWTVRTLFGSKLKDHECGFKVWKTYVLKRLVKSTDYGDHKRDRRMFWDSEMWVYAQRINYRILEIPVSWKAGAKSALRFRTELSMIKYILKLWVSREWTKRTLKS